MRSSFPHCLKPKNLAAATALSALLCALFRAQCPAASLVIKPTATDELFANPGMGWQTFHRFADEDKNLAGLPSGSVYCRFYWSEIEPRDGEIDFAKFDALLAHARKAGQKLAFRVMCTGSGKPMDVPQWLKDQGCRGYGFSYEGAKCWVPDFEDPIFKKAHFRLIRELGRRYDGHPDLDLLDIGTVGLWGEWHMSGTEETKTGKPVPLPSVEMRMEIIDTWREAFPSQSKVILIGSEEGMTRAATAGYGWRADCLGDMGGFSKNWNHMDNFYLQQLAATGATNVWKTAPVAFESCWDMRKWKGSGWDIRHIFDYALQCHASYINNKSAPLPEGSREEVERLLRRLGYRLVIQRLEHPSTVKANGKLEVRIEWENVGVAPPYRDYRVALRLRPLGTTDAKSVIIPTEISIRGWLPGSRSVTTTIRIPEASPTGSYELSVGAVHPTTLRPEVRLAIQGRDSEGWYPLSRVELE